MSAVAPDPTGKSAASLPRVDQAALQAALTESVAGEVRFDRLSRALYSTDASVYQIVPQGVIVPKSQEDIVATVKTCSRLNVPLTARGGGTSQAGQCIGPGLVLDCSKYVNRILEINTAERWVRVEPGCTLDDLNLELQPVGLQLPLDISTSDRATLGGMIANNSSGTHSLIYGKTVDYVLELKVALADGSVVQLGPLDDPALQAKCAQADLEGACYRAVRRLAAENAGEIERRFPKILRRVGGYNLDRYVHDPQANLATNTGLQSSSNALASGFSLAPLLVGSEGTLAVTLEAKLRLGELPRAKALLVVEFEHLLDALAATPWVLAHGPAAVEVVDKYVLDSTRLNAEAARLRDFLQGDPGAILIIELYAEHDSELPDRLEKLEADLRGRGMGRQFCWATASAAQARIWKLRRLSLGLSMAAKSDAKAISFVEDTAVAPERLRDYIAEFLDIIQRHGTRAGVYAHASVGCLHVRPVINLKTEEGVQKFAAIAAEVAELVLRYGGALSGEHGDGLVRSPFMAAIYGPVLYRAFCELKRAFDPHGILNPGKIVAAPPLTDNLRYGPAYVTPAVETTFDFTADGGLLRAAELCAGVGECRKRRGGTMCPSFQATREEQHSTRGRANALRLALTGEIGLKGLTDAALRDVFDLCLECKACKSECPTNVDMARLKAEFLNQFHRQHGLPWRSWFFGHVAWLSEKGGRTLNGLVRSRLGRWSSDKFLGIDRRRQPPRLARRSLLAEVARLGNGMAATPCKAALIPDTFTNFYEPATGLAAWRLLQAAGGARLIRGLRCCGRPMISNGMLDAAIENARHNVAMLAPLAAEGLAIVACEPSCILTIKDDYPALLRGDARRQAESVAACCFTFEEHLESALSSAQASSIRFRPGPKRILVQGHCHQRSLVGMIPLLTLLRRVPGAEVIDLDAGCCGLAGSFGYETEHYEISRLVGEQRLFPSLQKVGQQDAVVAAGFSCRRQIEHFTECRPAHPAQLLDSLMHAPG